MKQKGAEWLLLAAGVLLILSAMLGRFALLDVAAVVLTLVGLVAVRLLSSAPASLAADAASPGDSTSQRAVPVASNASGASPLTSDAAASVRAGRLSLAVRVLMGVWAVWTLASLGWSTFPEASAASWLAEVACPLLGFFGCYRLASIGKQAPTEARTLKSTRRAPEDADNDRPRYASAIEAACLLGVAILAAFSIYAYVDPVAMHAWARSSIVQAMMADRADIGWLAWIVLPFFVAMSARSSTRLAGWLGIVLALAAGFCSRNTYFGMGATLVLLIAFAPAWRRQRAWAMLTVPMLVIAMLVLVVASQLAAPGQAIEPVPFADDSLSRIWAFYADQAQHHLWLGVGFGKPLPAIAYADALPAALASVSPDPHLQAHQLFLNTCLQIGLPGMAVQCLLLAAIVRAFLHVPAGTAAGDAWLRAAGVALVVGLVAMGLMDDRLWPAPALAFWCIGGWLLGRAQWSGIVRHRATSGRSVAMRRLRRVGN